MIIEKIKTPGLKKEHLAGILNISRSTLNRRLNELLPDLLDEFPRYNIRSHIIPDQIFFWICKELGEDEETTKYKLVCLLKINEGKIDKILKIWGARSDNPFNSI